MKSKIEEIFLSILEQTDQVLTVAKLEEDTILLDSGLDSLGFVILVSVLEEELGFDPFSIMDEPIYPDTFGELVEIYQKYGK